MTGDCPKIAIHGAGLSTFQSGPKGTKMVNPIVFDHLGPFLGPSGPLWTISDKEMNFLPQINKVGFGGGAPDQKINFCLKCGTSPCRHDNLNSEKCKKLGM